MPPSVTTSVRFFICHRRHRGHRLDAVAIHFVELLDKGQDGVELALQMRDLVVGDGDARQMRDAADGGGVDGHGSPDGGAIAEHRYIKQ